MTRGCKVGGEYSPHLVTLRDRLATFLGGLAWATPGSIMRMMQARSGVQNLPNFPEYQA